MRSLALIAAAFLLVSRCGRTQDAVLILSPSPTVSVGAGTGTPGFSGDGAAATLARMATPSAMARDKAGNLYIADTRNHRVRRVGVNGIITTIAGTGTQGFGGDEGPATQAQLDSPAGLAVTSEGTVYIADTRNQRIRSVDATGLIHTVAGTGVAGFSGDGASAKAAQLAYPQGLAPGLAGDLYLADTGNHRVRRIAANGTIATVVGDGSQGSSTSDTKATSAHLDSPSSVAVRSDGSVLIADRRNSRILILQTDGTLRTLDTAALSLRRPNGVAVNGTSDTFVADTGNMRVAQVGAAGTGTVLGSGEQGVADTSAPPLQTPLGAPVAVLPGPDSGSVGFAALDREHNQLLQVSLARLTFPDTILATASLKRVTMLSNQGHAPLSVASVSVPSAFAVADSSTCGPVPFTLAAGTTCNLDLIFTPSVEGSTEGLLQLAVQNAAPQRLLLAGVGVRTGMALSSTTSLQAGGSVVYAGSPLSLTALVLGSSSAAPSGTVTFTDGTVSLGQAPLNSTGQSTLSTTQLQTGAHALSARYSGDATYQSSVSAPVQVTVAAPPDFTFGSSTTTNLSMQSGSAGTIALVLQPTNGVLNRTVAIAVSGLPQGTTINITPVPVVLGSDPVTVTIAFKLPVSVASLRHTPLLAVLLVPFLWTRRIQRRLALLSVVCLAPALLLQGCGGGYLSSGSRSLQSGGSTYTVSVTATCQSATGQPITHTTTFTVVVQS